MVGCLREDSVRLSGLARDYCPPRRCRTAVARSCPRCHSAAGLVYPVLQRVPPPAAVMRHRMPLPAAAVPHRCAVALTAVPATATIPPCATTASGDSPLAP